MVAQLLSASQVDLDTATAVLASCDWNLSVRSPTRGVDTCGAGCNTWLDVRFRLPWTSSPQAVAPRSNQLRVETSAGGARAVVMLVLPARRHLGRLPVVMMGAWARVCIRLRWLGFSADMLCAVNRLSTLTSAQTLLSRDSRPRVASRWLLGEQRFANDVCLPLHASVLTPRAAAMAACSTSTRRQTRPLGSVFAEAMRARHPSRTAGCVLVPISDGCCHGASGLGTEAVSQP